MQPKPRFYVAAMSLVGLFALAPMAFNAVVDPYDHNRLFDFDLDKQEISVKAHYPLYKMIEYPRIKASTVVLGDSRARALKDKYWQELGRDDVYNFAYGGATVFEIYDTFDYLRKSAELDTLIVSLPLRSMDERFKSGMNRVPEAIDLASNPFGYYTNWFVAKTGWRLLQQRYPGTFELPKDIVPSFVSQANAKSFRDEGDISVDDLLDPALCDQCALKTPDTPIIVPRMFRHHGLGLGRWAAYWPEIEIERNLPKLFAKQVGTNGAADWRRFKQSERLWQMVEDMAKWCQENDVRLVFLIPPTITEMQKRIGDFGLLAANHAFRDRLSKLGPVVDLDYDTAFTRDLENFTDAYHFGSDPARSIVGELLQVIDTDPKRLADAAGNRTGLACPVRTTDITKKHADGSLELLEGQSCRIWRQKNG